MKRFAAGNGLLLIGFVFFSTLVQSASAATLCPFCPGGQLSLAEEIETMDAAVVAKVVRLYPVGNKDDLAKAQFEVTDIIRGEKRVRVGDKFDSVFFGEGGLGSFHLLMGVGDERIAWSNPMLVTERARKYLVGLNKVPASGVERLQFFQGYLEDEDQLLAEDAYHEFAKVSYAQIKEMKPHLQHDRLVGWIRNTDLVATRRRMYLVLLGVCGTPQDLPLLEASMKSKNRKEKSGLDALIACYVTLGGEAGLVQVEELYLKNKQADYADTYSAIMALRFHATEGGVLEAKRVLASMKHVLKRHEIADLVIADLARGQDWSAVEELFELFKTADDKSTWVKVPVINYLRQCPLERAKDLLKECEKLDPAAVKRANTLFPEPMPSSQTRQSRFQGWRC
jgi:hypothetical protein